MSLRSLIPLVFLAFLAQPVLSLLANSKYPDLSCHPGYSQKKGTIDSKVGNDYCINRAKNSKDICQKKCLLVWIGVLKKGNIQEKQVMLSPLDMALEFVKHAFDEDKAGVKGATALARKIHSECLSVYQTVGTKNCHQMGPFYDCVDNVWKC